MKIKLFALLLFIAFNHQAFCQQKNSVADYWFKSKQEKLRIDKDNFIHKSIINLDSLSLDTIRRFLYYHGSIFSLNEFYSPDFYNIRPFINDTSNNFGIYNFGIEGSHSLKSLFYKAKDSLYFILDAKELNRKRIIKKSKLFYEKYQTYFNLSEHEMINRINLFYKKQGSNIGFIIKS